MIFRLFLLREKGGLIPKWQRATWRGIVGKLTIRDEVDPVLNRTTRVAQMHDPATGNRLPNVLPLRDVQVVRMTESLMILSGIERLEDVIIDRPFDVAQTWWLEFEDPKNDNEYT